MMTRRETFEKVKKHLLDQNEKSSISERCVFYSKNSEGKELRCAIGALMEKDQAQFLDAGYIDFQSSIALAHLQDQGVDTSDIITLKMLAELQNVHDNSPVEKWELHLENVWNHYA